MLLCHRRGCRSDWGHRRLKRRRCGALLVLRGKDLLASEIFVGEHLRVLLQSGAAGALLAGNVSQALRREDSGAEHHSRDEGRDSHCLPRTFDETAEL